MRKEDKLFEYAFGDLDAHEAQVFEAGLLRDEVTAEEAKFLQTLKGDLASFREIPEMQYSKERLRHAILGQGLKPTRPGFPWLNWVLAPGAAACVLALGYVLMNGTSRKDPSYIGGPNVADNTFKGGPKLPEQKLTPPTPNVATNTDSGDSFPDVPDTHWASEKVDAHTGRSAVIVRSSSKTRAKRDRDASIYVASRTIEAPAKGPAFDAAPGLTSPVDIRGMSLEASVAKVAADAIVQPASDSTMIMIDKDMDSGVGAPTAIEVNDTKNVVIGG